MDSGRRARATLTTAVLMLAMLLAFGLALTACTRNGSPSFSPAGSSTITTGVRGVALAGPTCPVERPNESPCVQPVSGAVILALDPARHEVGRAVTDATGAYFLQLPPGSYEIVPQPVSAFMGVAPETTVTVTSGAAAELNLTYDTGIR